jgi:hypothetical protein
MTDSAKTEGPDAESPRRLAAARGLGRAHALFPDTVAAAFARGSRARSTRRVSRPHRAGGDLRSRRFHGVPAPQAPVTVRYS